jgi:HSP20 family protein
LELRSEPIEKPVEKEVEKAEKPEEKSLPTEIKEEKEKWFEGPVGQLTVDVYQTEEELVIQSAIAGIKSEDLDISIESDTVIIKGVRERPGEEKERNYFYQECYWGPFSRKIILPCEVDSSRATATMKEGVLTIRMPKIEREKKRKIAVKE